MNMKRREWAKMKQRQEVRARRLHEQSGFISEMRVSCFSLLLKTFLKGSFSGRIVIIIYQGHLLFKKRETLHSKGLLKEQCR